MPPQETLVDIAVKLLAVLGGGGTITALVRFALDAYKARAEKGGLVATAKLTDAKADQLQMATLIGTVEAIRKELDLERGDKADLRAEIDGLKKTSEDKCARLQEEIDSLAQQVAALQKENSILKQRVTEVEGENEALRKQNRQLRNGPKL